MIKYLLIFLVIIFTSNYSFSQMLNLENLELRAHYELASDLSDKVGTNPDIACHSPIFESEAIYSRGCWAGGNKPQDSCLMIAPNINYLNETIIAIQVEFKSRSLFTTTIFQTGVGYRWLGLAIDSGNGLILKTGSQTEDIIPNTNILFGEWYSATVIHNKTDSITSVYLNDTLVYTKKRFLDHPSSDLAISNTDYSWGRAFLGYLKNLKVYSTNDILSINPEPANSNENVKIYPNPTNSVINVESSLQHKSKFSIYNALGIEMLSGMIDSKSEIDVSELPQGVYYLNFNNYCSTFVKN